MGARSPLHASPGPAAPAGRSPFALDDARSYAAWRQWKLDHAPRSVAELVVPVRDPYALSADERHALLSLQERCNMAIVHCTGPHDDGSELPRQLGAQLGLQRLDANWLADEDAISHITVGDRAPNGAVSEGGAGSAAGGRADYIPYTDRAIRWHTDGYYHPEQRRIRGMLLHCVRPAAQGGENALVDHERLYIALRDENPEHVRALMQPDAMTIPARHDAAGQVARAAQSGPVFSLDEQGCLHLRYTARTRSIAWKDDAATAAAVAAIERLLADGSACGRLHVRLQAGMGLVCHNVLHDRSAFVDDPAQPRLLYRARYLDRCSPSGDPLWPDG